MGRLELPLPQLGKGEQSLEAVSKQMQEKIRARAPKDLRETIVVRPYAKGRQTGLAIDYDDRAESFVYAAIEYPSGSGTEEVAVPKRPSR